VIIGGGMGGLCFAAALHRYDVAPFWNGDHSFMWIWQVNLKLSLIKWNVTVGLFCYYWNRVGLKAVVLEQSDRLRSEGTSITLWNNAMKVLELVDVADLLRNTYVNVLGYDIIFHRCKNCCYVVIGNLNWKYIFVSYNYFQLFLQSWISQLPWETLDNFGLFYLWRRVNCSYNIITSTRKT
jgi:hypothetical protein